MNVVVPIKLVFRCVGAILDFTIEIDENATARLLDMIPNQNVTFRTRKIKDLELLKNMQPRRKKKKKRAYRQEQRGKKEWGRNEKGWGKGWSEYRMSSLRFERCSS